MAVPKNKTSKSRTRSRRSANMRVKLPNLTDCSNCGNPVQRHRVCPKCGFYRDRQYLDIE